MNHYTFQIDKTKSLIIGKFSGVWNLNEAKGYTIDFEKVVDKMPNKNWVNLLDLKEWKYSMPEILPVIAGNLEWAHNRGMRKTAFVNCPNLLKNGLDLIIARSGIGSSCKTFENHNTALDWLET